MLANPRIAEISQAIGLASLGASDNDIARLAAVYWFTCKYGVILDLTAEVGHKALGAGLLSSIGELMWSCGKPSEIVREFGGVCDLLVPQVHPFHSQAIAATPAAVDNFQRRYFRANSLEQMQADVTNFCERLNRPFFPQYNPLTKSIQVTKAIRRSERKPPSRPETSVSHNVWH